ncbi:MAG TPA: 2OG-Fe(II) oxygenase [Hymenobacter sp.]|nr:2OG-Fe(II) oxygenase [Hymenobacter sp.]
METLLPTCSHLLPESSLICFVVPEAFSAAKCDELLMVPGRAGFQNANSHYPTYYRNNDRLVVDDDALAQRLFKAIRPVLPAQLPAADPAAAPWQLKELNNRLRFCRYTAGQYFHRHLDGVHYRSATVQSKLTFMVYLNDAAEFVGGRTLFYRSKDDLAIWAEYHPAKGDLIVFDHTIWHEGEQLLEGQKFVLRSDILYETTDLSAPAPAAPRDFAEGHLGYIWKVLPFDDDHLISGGRDTVLKVWNHAGGCTQRLEGHRNSVLCLAKLNESTLLSGSRDTTIKVWKQCEGQFRLARTLQLHHATVLSLARLTDDTFVSGAADGLIRVSNAAGEVLRTLSGHTDWVWQTLPLPGELLVTASEDGTLRLWNLAEVVSLSVLAAGIPPAHALLYEPTRRWLISGHYDGTLQVRQGSPDLREWVLLQTVPAHRGIVRTVVWLDDNRVASGGEDNQVKIWNPNSWECVQQHEHQDFVQALALLPDRQHLLSASYDGRLKVWPL